MKTRTKALVLALCAVLLVMTTVLATVAYLTSIDSVTNTFTVGKVKIELWEYDVDEYGSGIGSNPTATKENTYKLIPGRTYFKNPTVLVDAESEACWVFVKVENDIAAIEAGTTVADQMTANGWTALAGAENVYAYKNIAKADDEINVFSSFTVSSEVESLENYEGKTILVTAYAVQADGFDNAAAAWEAGNFNK